MQNKTLKITLLCGGLLTFAMSPAYADMACDTEVATIQAELAAPAAGISSSDLEQAQLSLNVLSADCIGGSSLDDVKSLANNIRSLLSMGGV